MKRILTIAIAFALGVGAMAQKSTLTATLKGIGDGEKVLVCEARGGRLVPVDTLTATPNGKLTVSRNVSESAFFALALARPQSPMVHVILLPQERVSMAMEFLPEANFIRVADVQGSKNMALYADYTQLMAGAIGNAERQATLANDMEQLIRTHASLLMSAFLVTYFESVFEQYAPLYKQVRDALIATYPTNDFVRHLDGRLQGAVVAGMEAPDIALPDRDGNERKLSDLRGKVVLIDFWASWCRPCRMANPHVVRLYQQYKDRGFDVYSVSLDNSREAWLRAIEADGLEWPNHVSDLRGWSSAGGKLYGISSIPSTVLVDAQGNIVARNLQGQALEEKLKEIFGE